MLSEPHQLELRTLRRDLESAADRNMLLQREIDRLRELLAESRTEHQIQLEAAMRAQALAESNLAKADAQCAVLKDRVAKAEADAREAWNSQAQQANVVKDVRAEVVSRMTAMMQALQLKEEELHKAQYHARDAGRLKERIAQLEKLVASRDNSLGELSIKIAELKEANDALVLELATVRSTMAARVATESAVRAESQARSASQLPVPVSASPPPPVPVGDPHVLETSHLVMQFREWIQEADKTILTLEEMVEAQFDGLQDLKLVLEKGVANSTAENGVNLDRLRLANLRRTEQRRVEQQLAAASDGSSTTNYIRTTMSNTKFNFSKLRDTVQQVGDFIGSVRQFINKHCGSAGIPAMSSRWDAWSKTRPDPLPLPGVPLSVPQSPSVPTAAGATFGSSTTLQQQLETAQHEVVELTKRLHRAENEIEELTKRMREDRLQSEAELRLRTDEYRAELKTARAEAAEERRAAQQELEQVKSDALRSRSELTDALETAKRAHAQLLQERENERNVVVGELQRRVTQLEGELERALEGKLKDAAAIDEGRTKRKKLKQELDASKADVARLTDAIAELNGDLSEAHKQIDQLEEEACALRSALDFELGQEAESSKMDAEAFARWKKKSVHVVAAAEAARLGSRNATMFRPVNAADSTPSSVAAARRASTTGATGLLHRAPSPFVQQWR